MKTTASILAGLLVFALPSGVRAQVRPQPGPGDPRMQSVLYDPNQVVQISVTIGYQVTIELAPDERVENVALGDSASWQVVANKRGDHLFIKALAPDAATNAVVLTDTRRYAFDLTSAAGMGVPAYIVQFHYADAPKPAVAAAPAPPAVPAGKEIVYVMSGAKSLRPTDFTEDGVHTALTFARGAPLPAVFTVGRDGQEALINGAMRDGDYVLDGIYKVLVFRLDHLEARAARKLQRKKH